MKDQFVPYDMLSPGFEGIYTGEKLTEPSAAAQLPEGHLADAQGQVYRKWSLWTWTGVDFEQGPEIKFINQMQANLGTLDDGVRRIRAHIASLAHCESGFPVTVDELLAAIGHERLEEPSFHNGCFQGLGARTTQPGQIEAMRTVEAVLRGWLSGRDVKDAVQEFPKATGFVNRTYGWLGDQARMTETRKLLLERMLLVFDFLTKRSNDQEAAYRDCFGEGGRGAGLDVRIAESAGLPKVYPNYRKEYRETLNTIADPEKKELYRVCGALAHGLHGLSDCHHSTFRWIEHWIHGIGTGKLDIVRATAGSEQERLGRLLFGYVLGLDRWLAESSAQFLLLDLGHVDLGFDAKNEILRVYAYLGADRTPVKEWLAACLWYLLDQSLLRWDIHQNLLDRAAQSGIGLRTWIASVLQT